MGDLPDITGLLKALLVICAVSVPLGLWKLVELVLWFTARLQWVTP